MIIIFGIKEFWRNKDSELKEIFNKESKKNFNDLFGISKTAFLSTLVSLVIISIAFLSFIETSNQNKQNAFNNKRTLQILELKNKSHIDFDFLSVFISTATLIVLYFTLRWAKRSAEATQKMLENEITPNVEVNMLYNKVSKQTYFWFYNSFEIPASVELLVIITATKEVAYNHALRIMPNHPFIYHFRRTAGIGLYRGKEIDDKTEVTVDVKIRSAMKNSVGINEYRKSYKFNKNNQEWDESTWSFPDLPFPTAPISDVNIVKQPLKVQINDSDRDGSKIK